MVTISRNIERGGIELSFPKKPSDEILEWIKSKGFGWGKFNKVWWIKYNENKWKEAHEYFNIHLPEETSTTPAKPERPSAWINPHTTRYEINKTLIEKHGSHITQDSLNHQFDLGVDIEKEHTQNNTNSWEEVKIAFDHLWEDPEYYTKAKPENWAEKELKKERAMTEIPKGIKKDVLYLLGLQKSKHEGKGTGGYNINLFKSSLYGKLKTMHKKGKVNEVNAILEYLERTNAELHIPPVFTKAHGIWSLRTKEEPKPEIIEQQIKSIEADQAMQEVEQEKKDEAAEKAMRKVIENLYEPGTVRPPFMKENILKGREIQISMPNGEKRNAVFAIVELDNIIASHNEENFHSEPLYPKNASGNNINDRNYKDDLSAQKAVMDYARELEPERLITTSRTPSGTPILSKDGFVVSGNNRAMSLKLAAKKYPENLKEYVKYLAEEIESFGFPSSVGVALKNDYKIEIEGGTVETMETIQFIHPILIRIDLDFTEYTTEELSKYNKDTKKSERPVDKAIKLSNILRDNSRCGEIIADITGEYETFSEFYANIIGQKKLARTLVECNLLTEQEMPAYFSETTFTEAGKEFVENLLAALILDWDALMATEQPGVKVTRQKLITSLPVLMKNAGLPEGSLKKNINDAVILQQIIKASGSEFPDFIRQQNLFGTRHDRKTVYINRLIDSGKFKFKQAIEGYNDAVIKNQGASLFGEKPSIEQIFDHWIKGNISDTDQRLIEASDVVSKGEVFGTFAGQVPPEIMEKAYKPNVPIAEVFEKAGKPYEPYNKQFLRDQDGLKIYLVDGEAIRKDHTEYVSGGHRYVYDWIPKDEVWIDDNQRSKPDDMEATIKHELFEIGKMRDEGMSYDQAHELANKVEKEIRNSDEIDELEKIEKEYNETPNEETKYEYGVSEKSGRTFGTALIENIHHNLIKNYLLIALKRLGYEYASASRAASGTIYVYLYGTGSGTSIRISDHMGRGDIFTPTYNISTLKEAKDIIAKTKSKKEIDEFNKIEREKNQKEYEELVNFNNELKEKKQGYKIVYRTYQNAEQFSKNKTIYVIKTTELDKNKQGEIAYRHEYITDYDNYCTMPSKEFMEWYKERNKEPMEPEKPEPIKSQILDVFLPKVKIIKPFISESQLDALTRLYRSEEKQAAIDIVTELAGIIEKMPITYETDDIKADDKTIYLHYFIGGSDWYIAEKDKFDKQLQMFGYAILNGDLLNAEWGYVSADELKENNVELDFYFTLVKFGELKKKWQGKEEISPEIKTEILEPIPEKPSFNPSDYKNPFELNKAIEKLLDSKWNDKSESWSTEEIEFIKGYSGYGGLDDEAIKAGSKLDVGSLFEFYTPEKVIEKMWGLAYKYGYKEGRCLEPSASIGLFFKREYVKSMVPKDAYEINKYSARICKLLYPEVNVNDGKESMYFEQLFLKNNYTVRDKIKPIHELVIGNPPYGAVGGTYMGMGESTYTHAKNYIDYFIFRGLDLLVPGGLLIYIIGAEVAAGGTPWLDQGTSKCKEMITKKGKLIDAYRLPEGLFARTNVISDLVIFKKR